MQIALIINIIEFIIQQKLTKIVTLTTINDKIDNIAKTQKRSENAQTANT